MQLYMDSFIDIFIFLSTISVPGKQLCWLHVFSEIFNGEL